MSKINEQLKENLDSALDDALSEYSMDKFKKKINDAYADIEMDIDYDLKDRLSYNLSYYVIEMAEQAVNSILEGNEERLRHYLSCAPSFYTGRDHSHKVIRGTLGEYGALALRKKIVDSYPELLKNERILDLEDQVASLIKQINEMQQRLENFYANRN